MRVPGLEGWPASACLDRSQSHEPKLVKKRAPVISQLKCLNLARGAVWARVPALFHGAWVGQGGAVGRGNSGQEGASQRDFTPGKTIRPHVLALGKGDNPQEGSVDKGAETSKRGTQIPQTSLNLAKAVVSSGRANTHTHTPISCLSCSFVHLHAPHAHPSQFRTSAFDDLWQNT